jgi:acyl-coenzyme A synthetase/AMP-(fatty) acid ligase
MQRKEQLMNDLRSFRDQHQDEGYNTKTDWSTELFVSKPLIDDYKADFNSIIKVTHSEKIGQLQNELTRYRFDSILHVDKKQQNSNRTKTYHQTGKQVLDQTPTTELPVVQGSETAYILYTSGTTGYP